MKFTQHEYDEALSDYKRAIMETLHEHHCTPKQPAYHYQLKDWIRIKLSFSKVTSIIGGVNESLYLAALYELRDEGSIVIQLKCRNHKIITLRTQPAPKTHRGQTLRNKEMDWHRYSLKAK